MKINPHCPLTDFAFIALLFKPRLKFPYCFLHEGSLVNLLLSLLTNTKQNSNTLKDNIAIEPKYLITYWLYLWRDACFIWNIAGQATCAGRKRGSPGTIRSNNKAMRNSSPKNESRWRRRHLEAVVSWVSFSMEPYENAIVFFLREIGKGQRYVVDFWNWDCGEYD